MSDIMIGSECADWWEQQIKDYKKELEEYAVEHPNYWGIAAIKATAADLGYVFFVDLARLGEGFAQGGVKGIVQDILRILSFIPPGKILQGAKPAGGQVVRYISNAKVWRHCGGGVCAPITIAQALQRTGTKFTVGLKEIADALGKPLIRIYKSGIHHSAIAKALTQLGLKFQTLAKGSITTFSAAFAKARVSEGPIMLFIKGRRYKMEKIKGTNQWKYVTEVIDGVETKVIENVGHGVLVGKTLFGTKIIDRYGVVSNFDKLAQNYGLIGKWSIDTSAPIYVFTNAIIDPQLIKLVEKYGILASLARVSMAVFDFNRGQVSPDFIKQDFQRFVEQRRGSKPTVTLPEQHIQGGKSIEVKRGDPARSTLSGIAKAEYQDWMLWPLIYDLNKDVIGSNPNQLKAGISLLILPKEHYTAQEISSARQRAPLWRNY